MLKDLERDNKEWFHFIRSHDILSGYASSINLHIDEIHLTPKGFSIVAQAFKDKLDELFAWRKGKMGFRKLSVP